MEQTEFYKTLLDNLYDGVYFVDRERRITYWNKGSERITGYQAGQVLGKSCSDNILNHCLENGTELCKGACPLLRTMGSGAPQDAEVYLHHADGHRIPVLVRVSPIYNEEGQVSGAVEIFSSNLRVFRARRRIHALEQAAFIDQLTGLANRRFIERKLKTALLEVGSESALHGLIFLDVDHFKRINDTFGHPEGDRVLSMVANNLSSNLRESDFPARWGGEEFLVLLPNSGQREVQMVAEKLRALVESSSLRIHETTLQVTISMGATLLRPGDTLETAIQRADELMYVSKTTGRNRVTFNE
jgi:diguanylate cyclase (GGDEF)-like protein/PAS domain S-box-containing protein